MDLFDNISDTFYLHKGNVIDIITYMEMLKNTDLKDLNEDIEMSFSPIRKIIKTDEIYNKYMNSPSLLELDFLIVSIESNVDDFGYKSPLNKWFKDLTRELDLFKLTISVLEKELDNKEWIKIFQEIRISSQNFIYSFYMENFYTAAVECRKILEGIIWMSFWKANSKELPNRANDAESFMSQLNNDDIKSLFRYISKLIHKKMQLWIQFL